MQISIEVMLREAMRESEMRQQRILILAQQVDDATKRIKALEQELEALRAPPPIETHS